jgi:hypothetical protein
VTNTWRPTLEPRIGWWVAVAFSLIIFLSTGIRFAVGPFLKPVAGDLGIDRGTFSLMISLSLFLHGAFVPLIGPLVDRGGSSRTIDVTERPCAASSSQRLEGGKGWDTSHWSPIASTASRRSR